MANQAQSQLSIKDLLAWTALSAVMFQVDKADLVVQWSYTVALAPVFWHAYLIGHSMVTGASLTGIFVLIRRRLKSLIFPIHPGDWLLVTQGFFVAAQIPLILWTVSIRQAEVRGDLSAKSMEYWWNWIYVVTLALQIFVFAIPAIACKTGFAWRLFLWSAVLVTTGNLSIHIYLRLDNWWMAISPYTQGPVGWAVLLPGGILLGIAAFGDIRSKQRIGWASWSGVVTVIITAIADIAPWI